MRQREEIGNPMSLSGTQFSELEIEAGVEISFPISNFLESDEIRPFLVSVWNERRLGSCRKQHSRDSMASWCGSFIFQACLSVFVLSKDINLDGELLPSGHGCKSSSLPGDIMPAKVSSLSMQQYQHQQQQQEVKTVRSNFLWKNSKVRPKQNFHFGPKLRKGEIAKKGFRRNFFFATEIVPETFRIFKFIWRMKWWNLVKKRI